MTIEIDNTMINNLILYLTQLKNIVKSNIQSSQDSNNSKTFKQLIVNSGLDEINKINTMISKLNDIQKGITE